MKKIAYIGALHLSSLTILAEVVAKELAKSPDPTSQRVAKELPKWSEPATMFGRPIGKHKKKRRVLGLRP